MSGKKGSRERLNERERERERERGRERDGVVDGTFDTRRAYKVRDIGKRKTVTDRERGNRTLSCLRVRNEVGNDGHKVPLPSPVVRLGAHVSAISIRKITREWRDRPRAYHRNPADDRKRIASRDRKSNRIEATLIARAIVPLPFTFIERVLVPSEESRVPEEESSRSSIQEENRPLSPLPHWEQ